MTKAFIITLVLTIVTPGDRPNMEAYDTVKTIDECVAKGTAFVAQDPKDLGGEFLAFACVVQPKGDKA